MSIAVPITQDGTRLETAGKYVDQDIVVGISDSIKKAAATYTPGTTDQTIAAGQFLSGAQTVKGDANLIAANIRSGKSIFGVAGSLTPGITPSGTKSITANGTYDVTEFASAAVNVDAPIRGSFTVASTTRNITIPVSKKCTVFVYYDPDPEGTPGLPYAALTFIALDGFASAAMRRSGTDHTALAAHITTPPPCTFSATQIAVALPAGPPDGQFIAGRTYNYMAY